MAYYKYVRVCKKCRKEYSLETPHGSKYCHQCRKEKGLVHTNTGYPSTYYVHRPFVLKRDNFCCRNCATKTKKLHVHHIDTNKKNNSFSNLITLCDQCHLRLHGTYEKAVLRKEDIFILFKKIKGKRYQETFAFLHKIKTIQRPRFFRGITKAR